MQARPIRQIICVFVALAGIGLARVPAARAQELGGAGTVQGTVKDLTGAAMPAVTVNLSNAVTGLKRSTTTDAAGRFVFRNLPQNTHHGQGGGPGFSAFRPHGGGRSAIPLEGAGELPAAGP